MEHIVEPAIQGELPKFPTCRYSNRYPHVQGKLPPPSWHSASMSDRKGFLILLLDRLETSHTPAACVDCRTAMLAMLHVAMKDQERSSETGSFKEMKKDSEAGMAGLAAPPLPCHQGHITRHDPIL